MPDAESDPLVLGDFYLAPSSESAKRAAILPTEGSEDATSVLGEISLPNQLPAKVEEYLPNLATEWVVHASLGKPLKAEEVASRFGKQWRSKHGSLTIFGRDTATNRWTYLISADGPEEVDGLQFAWAYHASWDKDARLVPPSTYKARLAAVESGLSKIAATKVRAEVSPQDAFEKAKLLSSLNPRYDTSVTVRLVAPKGKRFGGREVWDVMLCLGLKWGDMDCFHWENPSDYGDDFLFSVWTSTEPGYFLPEKVVADQMNVEDLVFGYSIPRCADPVTVYRRMIRAVKYAQKRLGGTITSPDGDPVDEEAEAREIKSICDELDKLGFRPGSENALRQF